MDEPLVKRVKTAPEEPDEDEKELQNRKGPPKKAVPEDWEKPQNMSRATRFCSLRVARGGESK